ncbi:MAG: hypothetical protein Q7S33_03990 [Nanoarchaeota archaeon]|nr:hypothetical protein [Nanoarchaeota archaeon]
MTFYFPFIRKKSSLPKEPYEELNEQVYQELRSLHKGFRRKRPDIELDPNLEACANFNPNAYRITIKSEIANLEEGEMIQEFKKLIPNATPKIFLKGVLYHEYSHVFNNNLNLEIFITMPFIYKEFREFDEAFAFCLEENLSGISTFYNSYERYRKYGLDPNSIALFFNGLRFDTGARGIEYILNNHDRIFFDDPLIKQKLQKLGVKNSTAPQIK